MSGLPEGLVAYKRTSTFTEAIVPPGLLKDHSTKEGTWGLIHIEAGRLHYFVTDPTRPASVTTLTQGVEPGVIEPTVLHRVEADGHVRFWVEFWRAEPKVEGRNSAAVDCAQQRPQRRLSLASGGAQS